MTRSKFKLPYVHRSMFAKSIQNRENFFRKLTNAKSFFGKLLMDKKVKVSLSFYFWKRNSLINKNVLNKKLCLYGGKHFIVINPNIKFLGFKLGQFGLTRKKPNHANKKRRQKKKVLPTKKSKFLSLLG